MLDLFGQAVAPVSPLVVRESLGGGAIRAIFGQRGIASSASAALQSSLVNRLKQRLPMGGSTLFAMTWNEKATPSGRSVCLLRASGHRTSGNGCGSWPTPKAQNANRAVLHGRGGQDLQTVVALASWPTPTARDHKDGNATSCQNVPINCRLGRQVHLSGFPVETAKQDQLNPAFSLWLMGYPTVWAHCGARVMPLSRKSRQRLSPPIKR